MPTLMTRHRPAALLLPFVLAAGTAACTAPARPDPVTTPPPQVAMLEIDPALDPRAGGSDYTWDWNLAARSGGLDALAAAVVVAPGQAPEAGLWRWAVVGGAVRVEADLGITGAVSDVALAVVDGSAVVAGTTTVDRRATAFVRTSRDLSTWEAVEVRPATARLTEATSSGTVPHVAGTTADGAVVWGEVADHGVDVTEVVPAAHGTRRTVVDVAASGAFGERDVVAVLYRETAVDGVERSLVVARDASGSWQEPSLVDPRPHVVANGVRVRGGGGWTVTGAAPLGPERGGILRPAAWTTADGRSWRTIDAYLLGDAEWGADLATDWVLGKPSETGHAIPLWEVGGRRVASLIGDDDADGVWSVQFVSDDAPMTGVTGVLEYAEGGVPTVFVTGAGFATVGTWEVTAGPGLDGSWWSLGEASAMSPPTSLSVTSGTAGFVATKQLVEVGAGWRTWFVARPWRYEENVLAAADPPPTVGDSPWREAQDDTGGRLLVRHEPVDGLTIRTATTLLAEGGDVGQGGLGAPGSEVADVGHDGERWIAVGADAPSIEMGEVGRATVWTSPDGAGWTSLPLDAGDARESGAEAVCPRGDLVVGWSRGHDRTTRPAAWRSDGGVVEHGVSADGDAWFSGCATAHGRTLVHGYVAGAPVLWQAGEEGRLAESWRAPVRSTFETPVPVGSGWAAWGTVDGDDDSGPVLWWSQDGEAWTAVALPTGLPVDDGVVVADGDAVVVLAEGAAGLVAWRVADLPQEPGGDG